MFQQLLALFAREKQRRGRVPLNFRIIGEKIVLRASDVSDWQDWVRLRGLSAGFLKPWEPEWPRSADTRDYFMVIGGGCAAAGFRTANTPS